MIPLFKSNYSIGKSLLPLTAKKDRAHDKIISIIDIAKENNLKQVILVEDTMLGFLQTYSSFKKEKIHLIFGLRLNFYSQNANYEESCHKNILFLKEKEGYKNLVKLASIMGKSNFGAITYSDYLNHSEGLELVVPFYDSYIYNNLLIPNKKCIPDMQLLNCKHYIEQNSLPEDPFVEQEIRKVCPNNMIVLVKSIFYKNKEDVLAFQARKLMENKSGRANTLDRPNLDGFGSNEFCWESYKEYINNHA